MYGLVHLRTCSFQPTEERLGIYSFGFFFAYICNLLGCRDPPSTTRHDQEMTAYNAIRGFRPDKMLSCDYRVAVSDRVYLTLASDRKVLGKQRRVSFVHCLSRMFCFDICYFHSRKQHALSAAPLQPQFQCSPSSPELTAFIS